MYVYIYIYIYVCVCVYIYIYIYIYIMILSPHTQVFQNMKYLYLRYYNEVVALTQS